MISEQIVRVANTPCLLLSVGSEVQILSGTPESTAASLFSGFAAFFVSPSPGNFTSVTGRFLYVA